VSYKLPIANYEITVELQIGMQLFYRKGPEIREGDISQHLETKKQPVGCS
jgi:hypothetical protein